MLPAILFGIGAEAPANGRHMMFDTTLSDLGRTLASAVCALLLSGLCIVTAVGPARAVETTPAAISA